MRPLIRARVTRAATAAMVAGIAGVLALVTIVLFSAFGQPWGTINDVVFVVEILAIAPMMLGSYELGGVTPLWPARASLGGGILACLTWAAIHVAFIAGVVSFDYDHAASGPFLIEDLALVVVGLWLTGAPPLAGPWLPGPLRWLGALSGLGFVLTGAGLILGGANHPLTWAGALGYLVLFPIWALQMAGVFSSKAAA